MDNRPHTMSNQVGWGLAQDIEAIAFPTAWQMARWFHRLPAVALERKDVNIFKYSYLMSNGHETEFEMEGFYRIPALYI
jgi:hypothetical protein